MVISGETWPRSFISAGKLTPARSISVAYVCRLCLGRHRRHTFATEMMRSGVSFAALMNLLGHSTPKMTLLYSEFTQTDLQREFRAARSQPRHLVPPPKAATSTIGLKPDLTSTLHALQVAQHVMEMFRRTLSDTSGAEAVIDRLSNRLTKIAAELRKLDPK